MRSPGCDDRVTYRVRVFPRTEKLPPRLADHAMAQGAYAPAGDGEGPHVEETYVRRGMLCDRLHHLRSVWSLHLEAVRLAATEIDGRPFVTFDLHVEGSSLCVVLDPVRRGRTADKAETVFV